MSEIHGVPLNGQGTPLPADFAYQGQWMLQDRMFLFVPSDTAAAGDVEMSTVLNYGRPDWCIGFNAAQFAKAFKIPVDGILAHNEVRSLVLVGWDDVPPSKGGTAAKRYVFQIGDDQQSVIIEDGLRSGIA